MQLRNLTRSMAGRAGTAVAASLLVASLAVAREPDRGVLVLTSTNDPSTNQVLVFQLETGDAPALSLAQTLPTGGSGGASGNAGRTRTAQDRALRRHSAPTPSFFEMFPESRHIRCM